MMLARSDRTEIVAARINGQSAVAISWPETPKKFEEVFYGEFSVFRPRLGTGSRLLTQRAGQCRELPPASRQWRLRGSNNLRFLAQPATRRSYLSWSRWVVPSRTRERTRERCSCQLPLKPSRHGHGGPRRALAREVEIKLDAQELVSAMDSAPNPSGLFPVTPVGEVGHLSEPDIICRVAGFSSNSWTLPRTEKIEPQPEKHVGARFRGGSEVGAPDTNSTFPQAFCPGLSGPLIAVVNPSRGSCRRRNRSDISVCRVTSAWQPRSDPP
jgi:hypothetical protein